MNRTNQTWTKEEKERLKRLYPFHRKDYILRHFPGRSERQIRSMASHLGCRKSNGPYFSNETTPLVEDE